MRVLLVNGSPHEKGSTYSALSVEALLHISPLPHFGGTVRCPAAAQSAVLFPDETCFQATQKRQKSLKKAFPRLKTKYQERGTLSFYVGCGVVK